MKITHAILRDFKGIRLGKIKELEMEFHAPVQVITAVNGAGKSMTLSELCPLPSVRTSFGSEGYKQLDIEHNQHTYQLISDFTNKTSPHSFKVDGEELNVSGNTDIQAELAMKHFGISPQIHKLIYNRTRITDLTKTERKNFFLTVNPLQMDFILDLHKKILSKIRDGKSNLQLLQTRKVDLESKMIPQDLLDEHHRTKQQLTDQLAGLDKLIYALTQHLATIKEKYQSDIEFKRYCDLHNLPVIPEEEILNHWKRISRLSFNYTSLLRGDQGLKEQEELHLHQQQLQVQSDNLAEQIRTISDEINKYHEHLQNTVERPISAVEAEITEITTQLSNYEDLPLYPIPVNEITNYESILEQIRQELFVFADSEVKMIAPEVLKLEMSTTDELQQQLRLLNQEISQYTDRKTELTQEISEKTDRASIPTTCTFSCGLKNLFLKRKEYVEGQLVQIEQKLKELTDKKTSIELEFNKKVEIYASFKHQRLLEHYDNLLNLLNYGYFRDQDEWLTHLVDRLNDQPLLIFKQLDNYLKGSRLADEYQKLVTKKTNLEKELNILVESNKTSTSFLQQQIQDKEKSLQVNLEQLTSVKQEYQDVTDRYNLYSEYRTAIKDTEQLQQTYTQGETALLVTSAIDYWSELLRCCEAVRGEINEQLRSIETIVKEQELLRHTYQSEILTTISGVEKDKIINEKIELALSPSTGIPHKFMTRYLNAMIHNVNYFVAQIWSYKLEIQSLSENNPLDYTFKLLVGTDQHPDLNRTSEGQADVLNLAWTLAILLQMKLLNQLPLFADELGRTFDPQHRLQLLKFLDSLIFNKLVEQLFLVNHYSLFTEGFQEADIICLSPDQMGDLPDNTNQFVKIIKD